MLSPTAPRFFSVSIYVCSSVMRRIFTAALRNAAGSCHVASIAVSKTRLPRRSRRSWRDRRVVVLTFFHLTLFLHLFVDAGEFLGAVVVPEFAADPAHIAFDKAGDLFDVRSAWRIIGRAAG